MNTYLESLKKWAVYVGAVVGVSVLSALINRYLGVTVEVPPPPPITVVVDPGAGGEPNVTVYQPSKLEK